MSQAHNLTRGAQFAIAVLVALGTIGGSMIIALGGFNTSSKRIASVIFVSGIPAYFLATIMFSLAVVGMVALLRAWSVSVLKMILVLILYASLTCTLIGETKSSRFVLEQVK